MVRFQGETFSYFSVPTPFGCGSMGCAGTAGTSCRDSCAARMNGFGLSGRCWIGNVGVDDKVEGGVELRRSGPRSWESRSD